MNKGLIISTIEEIPEKKVVKILGVVRGNTVVQEILEGILEQDSKTSSVEK